MKINLINLIVFIIFILTGCNKEILKEPTIKTLNITVITETTATSGGYVTDDGGSHVIARGVCWSTTTNPTISSSTTTNGSGSGSFSSVITELSTGVTIYIKSYATNSVGTSYGNEIIFTQPQPPTSQPPTSQPPITQPPIPNYFQKVIDCPMYAWNNKAYCGPITVGNLFAYWDINGYDDIFPGDIRRATDDKINEWMSSQSHYYDYFLPADNFPPYTIIPDKSEQPISDFNSYNCIADFLGTGFSKYNCPGGLTLPAGLKPGIDNYVKHFTPNYKSELKEYTFVNFPWDSIVSNIDRNHPMVALVNMDNDNNPYDHWALIIGCKYDGNQKYFGCVSLMGELIWFPYSQIYENEKVQQWRIFKIYTFNIQKK